MERVSALIQKLQQQLGQKESADKLLFTVQILYAELLSKQENARPTGSAKVAVFMPVNLPVIADTNQNLKNVTNATPAPATGEKIVEVLQVDEKEIQKELEAIKKNAESKNKMSQGVKMGVLFDPVEDVPTLAHQTQPAPPAPKEINESAVRLESLNERLKQSRTELAEKLTDGPIKDLKKGIGVNDRFFFINELFRGDEAMYERSIKTINNFSILAEAEYWIRRELKIKIGWSDSDPVVKQFDQLVRRRFI